MGLKKSVAMAMALLSSRDRRILILIAAVQASLALLDLIGVAMLGVVALLATAALTGATPSYLTDVVERAGLSDVEPLSLALSLALVAACLLVAKSVLSFVLSRRAFIFLGNRQAVVSQELAAALLSQPLLFVQRRPSQETAYALTQGVNAATLGILGNATIVSAEFFLIVLLTAGLALVDLMVTAFTVVFFVLVGLILHRVLSGWAGSLGRRMSTTEVASYASVQEVLRTYREVSVTGRREFYVERLGRLRWRTARVQADIQIMSQVSKYVFEVALIVGGGLLVLSQLVVRGSSAAVTVIAIFLAAASRMMPSLLRMQAAALSIRSAVGIAAPTFALQIALEDLGAWPQSRTRSSDEWRRKVAEGITGGNAGLIPSVDLDAVSVRYPGSVDQAIEGVSLHVEAGTSLALVGTTGAGKSTVADLILGVLAPMEGSVRIGGLSPSAAIALAPGAMTYVPQDIAVVSGTIRQNVALGLPHELMIDERIWESLKAAHLADFLSEQREGLDTLVGEHGVMLSGGQRQRLGLARALYTRPQLLVLDEATSAMDAETEQAVSDTISDLPGDITLVIIAHRLATIRHCDQVAYLEAGRLRAIGSFADVRLIVPEFNHQAELLGL